jgi:hypothetical protein
VNLFQIISRLLILILFTGKAKPKSRDLLSNPKNKSRTGGDQPAKYTPTTTPRSITPRPSTPIQIPKLKNLDAANSSPRTAPHWSDISPNSAGAKHPLNKPWEVFITPTPLPSSPATDQLSNSWEGDIPTNGNSQSVENQLMSQQQQQQYTLNQQFSLANQNPYQQYSPNILQNQQLPSQQPPQQQQQYTQLTASQYANQLSAHLFASQQQSTPSSPGPSPNQYIASAASNQQPQYQLTTNQQIPSSPSSLYEVTKPTSSHATSPLGSSTSLGWDLAVQAHNNNTNNNTNNLLRLSASTSPPPTPHKPSWQSTTNIFSSSMCVLV